MKSTTKTVEKPRVSTVKKSVKTDHTVNLDSYSQYVVVGVERNGGQLNILTPHTQSVVDTVGVMELGKQVVLNKNLK